MTPGIPAATYRVQLSRDFGFREARLLVPYLRRLGVSDLYASPILGARRGSPHGYDVTDPTRLNPELGTEKDFDALSEELDGQGMGLLLDIVPNHMAASPENPWWRDVLDRGRGSPFAAFFDTDWLDFGGSRGGPAGHRRFFDIGDLVGVRVEDPRVFEATHALVLRLISQGRVSGLRIDHIDGLYDPLEYLLRLQRRIADETGENHRIYVVVEKILSGGETVPAGWPVAGTTGYDFIRAVSALFVDGRGAAALGGIYARFAGSRASFPDVAYEKQKQVISELFPGEIKALGRQLGRLARQESLTIKNLTGAIAEISACLPVYRTYIRAFRVSRRDRLNIEYAVEEARRRHPDMDAALDFVRRLLTLDLPDYLTPRQKDARLDFVMRWQQLTGAVMAKGFEDTALYGYNRLVSLNEVGGDPASSGLSLAAFHRWNRKRREGWPHTLNATSTHDTKRSEDVRARISVLSEIPGEWEKHVVQWREWNRPKKLRIKGRLFPEANTEILLYQTLVGAWPLFPGEVPAFKERLGAYMLKVVREAKAYTSWLAPDADYEHALSAFIDSILEGPGQNGFLASFLDFEEKIAFYGALNAIAQVLLKVASPGVPDFYQGTELWDFSLVDPDNRRPVDFEERAEMLADLIRREAGGQIALASALPGSWRDGRLKLYVTYKALNTRRECDAAFREGECIPLRAEGRRRVHVGALARRYGGAWVISAVPRRLVGLVRAGDMPVGRGVWGEGRLLLPEDAPENWLNIFTGEKLALSEAGRGLPLADIFRLFPVAMLKSL